MTSSSLLSKLFHFVLLTTKKYGIDESHGLSHSMNVLHFAHDIFNDEVQKLPYIKYHEKVIYVSAILHDMCDKKYMDQDSGISEIYNFLGDTHKVLPEEITAVNNIISTMSYSTVKKNGFPDLYEYQPAYHIVREADLLSAYDFDRCMIYNMNMQNGDVNAAFDNASKLFENRVFKHEEDGLLLTDYALLQDYSLKQTAKTRINAWRNILNNRHMY
jgi:HD superfamily phosphodiesterase